MEAVTTHGLRPCEKKEEKGKKRKINLYLNKKWLLGRKARFVGRMWTALDFKFQLLKEMWEVPCWFSYMVTVH